MRKILYLFIYSFIFCALSIVAQEAAQSVTLSKQESGNKNYIARDFITLKPGFEFKADNSSSFSASIDECLLFPPTNNTYVTPSGSITTNPALGGVVGSIPGHFDVSPSGAATYTIPIEVAPGVNGMQPNISLVYNSQAGNGIAGWGWNIGGVSMISRVPKSLYYDNEVGAIDWTKDSPLALDGQRLIKISSTEYRTENESFSQITTGESIKSWGPEVIKVQTKDGLIMEYGRKDDITAYSPISSDKRMGWMLSKVTDPNGNYTKYSYGYAGGIQYKDYTLLEVSYGNTVNNQDKEVGRIGFNYTIRNDVIESYIDGTKQSNNRLLKSIVVYSNKVLQKTYSLKYDFSDIYSHLEEVQIKTQNDALNPVSFKWGQNDIILKNLKGMEVASTPLYNEYINKGFVLDYLNVHSFGDINNDGLLDILVKMRFKKSKDYKFTYVLYRNTGSFFSFVFEGKWEDNITSVFFLDSDDDGKDELYVFEKKKSGNISKLNGFGYKNNVFGSIEINRNLIPSVLINNSMNNYGNTEYVIPGDYLGDGIIRLALFGKNNEFYGLTGLTRDGKKMVLSSNDAFKGNQYSKVYITNINGNSKPEFLLLSGNIATFYEYSTGVKIDNDNIQLKRTEIFAENSGKFKSNDLFYSGDFDGDGNTDLLIRHKNESKWAIWWSNGKSLTQEYLSNDMNVYLDDPIHRAGGVLVMDIDNDGRSDIISGHPNWIKTSSTTMSASNYKLEVLISKGRTRGFELELSSVLSEDEIGRFTTYGSIDNKKNYGVLTKSSVNNKIVIGCIPLYRDIKYNKIHSINNDIGKSLTLDYDRINKIGLKKIISLTIDESEVISQIPENMIILSKAVSEYSDQSYTFSNALFHRYGKGFLGFSQTKVKENINGTELLNTLKLNTDYNILIPDKTETKVGSTIVSQTIYDYNVMQGLKPRQFILQLGSVEEKDKLNNTTIIKSFTNYDSYGNPKTISTNWGDGISETQSLVYTDAGSWCDNKIKTITTTKTIKNNENNDENISYKKSFEYFSNGNLKEEILNPKHSKFEIKTSYQYDSFGNPTKVTVSNKGKSRSKQMTYTSSGRFLASEKDNQLNETVTYSWDENKAQLKSKTTSTGTTTYEYDGIGRLVRTKYPDKVESVRAYQWAGSGKPANAKYYVYEETSGQGSTTTWYDALGRELRTDFYGFDNKKKSISTEYNFKGQLYRVSEPYFFSSGVQNQKWAETYNYDDYGRITNITTPQGTTTFTHGKLTKTVKTPMSETITKYNSIGQVTENIVNGKSVKFEYHPSGAKKNATPGGQSSLKVSYEYDILGNLTKTKDPNSDTITVEYNGFGEIIESKRKIHDDSEIITTYSYLPSGLLDAINLNGEVTKHTYDSKNRLKSVAINGVHTQTFEYDRYNRPISLTEVIDGKTFKFQTEYDGFGRVKKETYPTGYYTTNQYDDNGFLKSVSTQNGQIIYEVVEENAKGQIKKYKHGGDNVGVGYSAKWNLPTQILSKNLTLEYGYDSKGFLNWKLDYAPYYAESYEYDDLLRLSSYEVLDGGRVSTQKNSMQYDATTGSIKTKGFVGDAMSYQGQGKPPHAVSSIAKVPSLMDETPQNITYTDFNKVKQITQGNKSYTLTYGVDRQRIKSVSKTANTTTKTKYYLGNYEEEHLPNGKIRKLHYIYTSSATAGVSGSDLKAIYVENNGKDTLYYTHTDYQGNLIKVTNENGNVIEQYAYDPWGLRRNPTKWHEPDTRKSFLFDRGYTLHEHLDDFGGAGGGLINMNGRVYDPLLAQFLSPDPYIQAPGNWLNYNRYAYGFNNPLMYSDPDGEFILMACLIATGVSMVIDYGIQVGMNYANGYKGTDAWLNKVDFFDVAVSGVIGGLTAGWGASFKAGESVGKLGMFVLNNSKYIKAGEIVLTSAIDITGEGWQEITFDQFGQRAVTGLATMAASDYISKHFKKTPEVSIEQKVDGAIDKARGTSVLGHYPDYVNLSEEIGANRFEIPTEVWNKMSSAEQWSANKKFLDRMILRGDRIRLATPLNKVKPGSFLEKELNYLFEYGYSLSSDGLWLIK